MGAEAWTEERVGAYLVRVAPSDVLDGDGSPLTATIDIQDETVTPEGLTWETVASGFLKWDGCMEIGTGEASFHFCEMAQIVSLGEAMKVARRLGASLIPAWEGDAKPYASPLAQAMIAISQRCYDAEWLNTLAGDLWAMVHAGAAVEGYGNEPITAEEIANLRNLAAASGCWCDWSEAEGRPVDVPLGEWLGRFWNVKGGAT